MALDIAHDAACIHSQGEPVAVNDDVSLTILNVAAYHQPRNAAHGGVVISFNTGDRAGDGEVFNGADTGTEQAAADPFLFVDMETTDRMSGSVKGTVERNVLVANGHPLHAGEVDVIGKGHHQIPLLLVMQCVDGMDKVD